jgi:hypothetical protein
VSESTEADHELARRAGRAAAGAEKEVNTENAGRVAWVLLGPALIAFSIWLTVSAVLARPLRGPKLPKRQARDLRLHGLLRFR